MGPDPITTEDSAVVLIDHSVGFANAFRSHSVEKNVNNVTALAKTARAFDLPLVVTNGEDTGPPGPLYPQLLEVLGDEPIVRRRGQFNAFEHEEFAEAVKATGRRTLLMAGLMTEGCLLLTALEAVRRGYRVYAVVDASAGETLEAHEAAVQRLIMGGVTPAITLSIAAELQVSWDRLETVQSFAGLFQAHSPTLAMSLNAHQASQVPAVA